MQFLKLCCWKEALKADIKIGEIKNKENFGNPVLEVNVSISHGTIKSATDFLYIQPQLEQPQLKMREKHFTNTSTASSQHLDHNNPRSDDKEPLPKRLKEVKKERVVIIEKCTNLCDNLGTAYVDLAMPKGKYKIYFLRIENELRILSNSRLEALGMSKAFTINQLNSGCSSYPSEPVKNDDYLSYEESYSYSNQDSLRNPKQGSQASIAESSLDSAILMRQIQSQIVLNSQSHSVYSHDQTKALIGQTSINEIDSFNHHSQQNDSASVHLSEGNSKYSQSSSQTIIIKKENDETMILTGHNCAKTKHKRAQNCHFALEDISHQGNNKFMSNQSLLQRKQYAGKENQLYLKSKRNENFEQKSQSFTNGIINKKKQAAQKKITNSHQQEECDLIEDELDVRFVNDIESIVPPRFNPETRTYFKCSIYSPSNRLYTVNEEVNSNLSDGGEQFSSSQIMSNFRVSASKFNCKHTNSDRLYTEGQKIDEEENDDEAINISEGKILPRTPTPNIIQQMQSHFIKDINATNMNSNNISREHTRTNSTSKAQSLRNSVYAVRP